MLRAGKKLNKTNPKKQAKVNIKTNNKGSTIFFNKNIDLNNETIDNNKFIEKKTNIEPPIRDIKIGKQPFWYLYIFLLNFCEFTLQKNLQ